MNHRRPRFDQLSYRPLRSENLPTYFDTTKFHTHWSPEVDYQLLNSRTIPQHSSRPEGPRL